MDRHRLERIRHEALHLHKLIVDDARAATERVEGRLTAHQFLDRLLHDAAFAWLKPLSELIVAMDEWLDTTEAEPALAVELVDTLRVVLTPDPAGDLFQQRYGALLQDNPAVVLAHAATLRTLGRR